MNPSGVHLSSDEIYIPLIYALCSIVWAFLIVIWAVNAMIYYKVREEREMQRGNVGGRERGRVKVEVREWL